MNSRKALPYPGDGGVCILYHVSFVFMHSRRSKTTESFLNHIRFDMRAEDRHVMIYLLGMMAAKRFALPQATVCGNARPAICAATKTKRQIQSESGR